MLPMLDLRTRDGAPLAWRPLWQRRNLLVLFAHPACETCRRVLADWGARAGVLAAENATALAVFEADPGADVPGVTVVVDPARRLAARVGAENGTALAVDRFFEVIEAADVHAIGAETAAEDAIGWIRLAERRCPECGIGTW